MQSLIRGDRKLAKTDSFLIIAGVVVWVRERATQSRARIYMFMRAMKSRASMYLPRHQPQIWVRPRFSPSAARFCYAIYTFLGIVTKLDGFFLCFLILWNTANKNTIHIPPAPCGALTPRQTRPGDDPFYSVDTRRPDAVIFVAPVADEHLSLRSHCQSTM